MASASPAGHNSPMAPHIAPSQADPSLALHPTNTIDSENPAIVARAAELCGDSDGPRERAVKLFYWVRDAYRYDPFNVSHDVADYRAGHMLTVDRGYCITKSVLLAALARASGIPTRLGFADVKNHLQSERLKAQMKSELFAWHGYVEFHLDGRWVKASSAFNIEMCERFGTRPLEFDGVRDALLHEFDQAGNRHMEYVTDRGSYDDLPFTEIMTTFAELYGEDYLGS